MVAKVSDKLYSEGGLSDTLARLGALAAPSRKTELKPDAKGRYRPYLGWKTSEEGTRRQHRFNLGTDRKEAERRMARLRELWTENEMAAGEPTWTLFALYAAKLIAEGTYKIPIYWNHLRRREQKEIEAD